MQQCEGDGETESVGQTHGHTLSCLSLEGQKNRPNKMPSEEDCKSIYMPIILNFRSQSKFFEAMCRNDKLRENKIWF